MTAEEMAAKYMDRERTRNLVALASGIASIVIAVWLLRRLGEDRRAIPEGLSQHLDRGRDPDPAQWGEMMRDAVERAEPGDHVSDVL